MPRATCSPTHQDRLGPATRMEARFALWKAARNGTDLAQAKELLDYLVEHAPEEDRESIIENVPLHRANREGGGAVIGAQIGPYTLVSELGRRRHGNGLPRREQRRQGRDQGRARAPHRDTGILQAVPARGPSSASR